MKLGTLKQLEAAARRAQTGDGLCLMDVYRKAMDQWLLRLEEWSPRSRLEIVQTINIARHIVRQGELGSGGKALVLKALAQTAVVVYRSHPSSAAALRVFATMAEACNSHEASALRSVARSVQGVRSVNNIELLEKTNQRPEPYSMSIIS